MKSFSTIKKAGTLLAATVAAAMLLVGCGSATSTGSAASSSNSTGSSVSTSASSTASSAQSTSTDAAQTVADADTEDADGTESTDASGSGKTLVVYYSATGDTKRDAEEIAKVTGADLFEITPAEPYTQDDLNWSNPDSRVSREHEDESLRDVPLSTTEVPDWDTYDTVFIGYPIWWVTSAWPTDSFVKANDFTGKTVIPFCSSLSSGIGSSAEDLAKLAGTGNWQEGQRFSSSVSEEDIDSWVESLGITK